MRIVELFSVRVDCYDSVMEHPQLFVVRPTILHCDVCGRHASSLQPIGPERIPDRPLVCLPCFVDLEPISARRAAAQGAHPLATR